MKYKYTGRIPAVILVEDDFVTIKPGEIREFVSPPATQNFSPVVEESKKPKKVAKKTTKKKENINATDTNTSSMG